MLSPEAVAWGVAEYYRLVALIRLDRTRRKLEEKRTWMD